MSHPYLSGQLDRLRAIAAAIVSFVILLMLTGGSAHAAPQVITLTPTSFDNVIKPGSTYTGSFQIVNQGQGSYTFRVYATPYSVQGEDYAPDFTTPLPNAPNVANWFKFSPTTVHIDPGQSATIGYTITMPQSTPPGGYYAAAFAETRLPPKANSVILNERVGEIFYLQAAGPVAKKGQLLTWQSNFFQKPPLTSTLRLENSGGVHYQAAVDVTVRDMFGHPKYSLKTTKEVLPQTTRRITIPWKKTPSLGLFKVNGTVSFLNQHETLPTKWVLVVSQTVRLYVGIILLIVVLLVAGQSMRKRRSSKKAKK